VADRDVGGSLAGTKQHTINFAQMNWIAFVALATAADRVKPEAARQLDGVARLSIIAEVALISSMEGTSKCRRAPLFNPRLYTQHSRCTSFPLRCHQKRFITLWSLCKPYVCDIWVYVDCIYTKNILFYWKCCDVWLVTAVQNINAAKTKLTN